MPMTKAEYKKWKSEFLENVKISGPTELQNLLDNAIMSPKLQEIVEETKKAIESGDLKLASELSTVKGFICSKMDLTDEECLYREDGEHNGNVNADAYMTLDRMQHNLAMGLGEQPSGSTIITAGGVISRKDTQLDVENPVLKDYNDFRLQWRKNKLVEFMEKDRADGINVDDPVYQHKMKKIVGLE